jgi:predicted metal-dependent phosphoesterase TrpH
LRVQTDLHSHSTRSDGLLAPAELVARAAARGVGALALTDHDDTSGLEEAGRAAAEQRLELISGVEISVTWRGHTIHVVGLHIDASAPELSEGLGALRAGRSGRAAIMAAELEKLGMRGALEGARRHARNPDLVGRAHFARFLVQHGHAADVQSVFRRYLAPGKPGYVPHQWAALADAVGWILAAGGQAVLAHPGRYGLSAGAMEALLGEFRAAGGEALEVVTGSHSSEQMRLFGALAAQHAFAASRGSDFHGPEEGADFGTLPPLDPALRPVWRDWAL